MNTEAFVKALAAATNGEEDEGSETRLPNDVAARRLLDAFADLSKRHDFKPGDLVELKPGLGGYQKIPGQGQPGIVTEIIDPPLVDHEQESGSPLFGIKHDIRVMVITTSKNRHIEYAFDSRLFQPYTEEIA